MKFGLLIRKNSYKEIREQALLAEKYGFDSVHVDDHFFGDVNWLGGDGKRPYLEVMSLMTAIAVETEKVKLGHHVLCNSYRNPALLAKMISSLDHISNGRALLWIGAGWREEEYKAYGYLFPSAKERVSQFEEALTIFKKLFTEEVTNFDGKYWKLENCKNFPKPIQKPYPQIVVGALKKRMLTIACREANGINIAGGEEALMERIDFINTKLREFGRDPSKFEISVGVYITLVRNEEEKDEILNRILEQMTDRYATKEAILKDRFIGTTDEVRERIQALERIGAKKIVVFVVGSSSIENPLRLFNEEMMSLTLA